MKTHRCKGSLKHEISIRCSKKWNNINCKNDEVKWRLFKPKFDDNWDSYALSHISEIEYCPFCGKKLD